MTSFLKVVQIVCFKASMNANQSRKLGQIILSFHADFWSAVISFIFLFYSLNIWYKGVRSLFCFAFCF